MAVRYEVSVQVPHIEGMWCPHVECTYESALVSSLAEGMNWLANNQLSYLPEADSSIDIRIDGHVEVSWTFRNGQCECCVRPR